jgi:hypothetical protein|nr:MAG TPA: hypothetical protein [Caudoviricetes sp.]
MSDFYDRNRNLYRIPYGGGAEVIEPVADTNGRAKCI